MFLEAMGDIVHLKLLNHELPMALCSSGFSSLQQRPEGRNKQGWLTKVQMTWVRVLYDLIVVAVVRQHVSISPPEVLISANKKGPLARGVVLN